jgi:cation diffusion facilitator family transporter
VLEKRVPLKKGEEAARRSTIVLIALAVLRGAVSFASGSIALLAGTIDSFTDVFSSIAVWVGLNVAKKKPTERFPYGYYKAETFALLVVSLIFILSSILIIIESFQKLFVAYFITSPDLALVVAALSAVIYYILAKYKTRIGRQIGSQALISEGLNSRIDVYTSLLVFAGVFLNTVGYPAGEALIGLLIGVYVLMRGLLFGKDAALVLMDVSPSPERVKEMRDIAESVPGVQGTHNIKLRKSGPVFFAEMHVELREGLSLERAHAISEEIERRIKERFSDLESVTVHVGLAHKNTLRIAVPIVEDEGLDSLTSQHFGSAPVFAFVDVQKNQVIGFYVKENEGAKLSQKKGMRAANLLIGENIDALIAGGVGEGPFHTLGDSMVLIYRLPTGAVTVQEAIRLLNENLLQKMTTSTEKQIEGEI